MKILIFLQKPTSNLDQQCHINATGKPWRFLEGDIENEKQVMLLVGN